MLIAKVIQRVSALSASPPSNSLKPTRLSAPNAPPIATSKVVWKRTPEG